MPSGAKLADFYPANYHSMGKHGFLTTLRNDMRLRRLRSLLVGDGAMLDFGCGRGQFLIHAAAHLRGVPLFGYEIGSQTSVETHAGGQVTIVRGDTKALLDILPPCSLITMNHVIEHLPDPLETLSALLQKLAPGGTLEGQTPAAGSLEHRTFGRRWSGYHAPRHTVVFSPRGLEQLFGRAGYSDYKWSGAFNPAGIAVSLATLRQAPEQAGVITRGGLGWLVCLALASCLAPIDLLSGAPGIFNFKAHRPLSA
ncbi:MAG TPA: class I SAM-dependent methyltransferase [Polyangiaceae bacterium]|nr:class I SAM-dependent methyltransferase [Polyangiaceae bacterium]